MNNKNMDSDQPLKTLYLRLTKLYDATENSKQSSSSDSFQKNVSEAVKLANLLMKNINELSLFSNNEDLDEVSTESLPYLSLSALLAYFLSKQTVVIDSNTPVTRSRQLTLARACFCDFLRLCVDYGVPGAVLPKEKDAEADAEVEVVHQSTREEKMKQFRAKRDLSQKLTELRKQISDRGEDGVDEELKRKLYLMEIKNWICIALEEVDSIDKEMPLVLHMEKLSSGGGDKNVTRDAGFSVPAATPLRPFILTRTRAQAAVFGAGYPSVPTYSLDEFYEAQVSAGVFPVAGSDNHGQEDPEERAIREEIAEETDDPVALQKKRDWDDWVETHPRGCGNRYNRS